MTRRRRSDQPVKEAVIYVRCEEALETRLDAFAKQSGIPRAVFIRYVVEQGLEEYKDHRFGDTFPRPSGTLTNHLATNQKNQ